MSESTADNHDVGPGNLELRISLPMLRLGRGLIMDGSVTNFWPATHQQIYLELKKLDEHGLVRFKEKVQRGKPNKKVYSITQSGLSDLKSWIAEPSDLPAGKDQLMVKLFASHLVERPIIQTELKRLHELHQAKLTEYLEIKRSYFSEKKLPTKLNAQYLTLRRGIHFQGAWLKWCDECLKRLGD